MRIAMLMENATTSHRLCAKHGLSVFVETDEHKILFDMGPDASFLDNAKAMGIDVTAADIAVLSHGHFDHAGGMRAYLDATEDAPVYVNEHAFEEHVVKTPAGYGDIGADPALAGSGRIVVAGDYLKIDEQLELFAAVEPRELVAASNKVLMERVGDEYRSDRFLHEQSLIVREGKKAVLLTGCSHCGIVNIMKRAEELMGRPLDVVVGGFHLMNPASGEVEDPQVTRDIAAFLAQRPTRYFTFHCTGLEAYSLLRDTLGERIRYLTAGSRIEI